MISVLLASLFTQPMVEMNVDYEICTDPGPWYVLDVEDPCPMDLRYVLKWWLINLCFFLVIIGGPVGLFAGLAIWSENKRKKR